MSTWTEYRTIKDIEYQAPGADEVSILQAEVEVTLSKGMYGSDADGNRGEVRTSIEDFRIESIFDLGNGHDVTEAMKEQAEVYDQISDKIADA